MVIELNVKPSVKNNLKVDMMTIIKIELQQNSGKSCLVQVHIISCAWC